MSDNWMEFVPEDWKRGPRNLPPKAYLTDKGLIVFNSSATNEYLTSDKKRCTFFVGGDGRIGIKLSDDEAGNKVSSGVSGTSTISAMRLAKKLGLFGQKIQYSLSLEDGIIVLTPAGGAK